MKNNKGFTLTEVLLAALIVGVIGVALAALTTSATREGGHGRTKMILRNQLSLALRQLRQDIHEASAINFPSGMLLQIERQHPAGPGESNTTIEYALVTTGASSPAGIQPQGSTVGNTITRKVGAGTAKTWLSNVKVISGTYPRFYLEDGADSVINSILRVDIIVEVPSNPVVNDVVHETFMLPHGIDIKHPTVTP